MTRAERLGGDSARINTIVPWIPAHYGQHVAMVVAETREQAQAAAALVETTYERDTPVLAFDGPRTSPVFHPGTPDTARGNVRQALAAAAVRVNQTYTTAENTNNPIGLFATVAVWDAMR